MGLFDFIFSRDSNAKVQRLNDRIWLTPEAKFDGIVQQLYAPTDAVAILLIAHFEDTLERLRAIAAAYPGDSPLLTALAGNLSTDIGSRLRIAESKVIDLIITERHALLSIDDAVVRFAEQMPCKSRIRYHLSLEDPLMRLLITADTRAAMRSLGMNERECIESAMVTRKIIKAQKRIESSLLKSSDATSAAEWVAINLPDARGL